MLDINLLRKNPEIIREEIKKRNLKIDLGEILQLDRDWRATLGKAEEIRSILNKEAKSLSKVDPGLRADKISKLKKQKEELKELEKKTNDLADKMNQQLGYLPNISHPDVPLGKDETGNVVVKKVGKIPVFNFPVRDHVEIGKDLDIIDIERGVKVSGSRFYYLKNEGVDLEWALINFTFDLLKKKGFTPLSVPMLVKEKSMFGTGFFPAEKNEIYHVNPDDDNLYLIGTAEVPIASYHMNEELVEEELPKYYYAFSSCFRREAGAYGKDTKGVLRVHQFDKVEMFKIVKASESWEEYEKLLAVAEEILQQLELPYQKLNMCTGDISPASAMKYDFEVYIPSQKRYRELISGTNTTDYQSRRLSIKGKIAGKKEYLHMMNCTAMASTRFIIAILENCQNADGSIELPEKLWKYMGKKEIKHK